VHNDDDDDDDDRDDELHTPSRQWDIIYVRSCAVCTRYVCAVLFCLVKCNCCSQLSDVHFGQQEFLLSPQWWSTSCYWHIVYYWTWCARSRQYWLLYTLDSWWRCQSFWLWWWWWWWWQLIFVSTLREIRTVILPSVYSMWRSGLCLRTSITTTWLRSLVSVLMYVHDTYDDDDDINCPEQCWSTTTLGFWWGNCQRHLKTWDLIWYFIANRMCNKTVTMVTVFCHSRIWHDPVIFPVIGPSVLSAANQNAWVMTH